MSAGVKKNLELGERWLRAGDTPQAERCFASVLKREPDHLRPLGAQGKARG